MEQRIGSNSQPLAAAAVDPSHIPGLTAPVSVTKEKQEEPEDIKPTESAEQAETVDADEAVPADGPAAARKTAAEPDADLDSEPDAKAAAEPDAKAEDNSDGEDAVEGPVFEAADRRAKIVADHRGVRLQLDDQACEFRWDEIGAIETESPRFGKRFTVTVHTPDRRWYPIEIEAKAKSEHAAWETRIDEVLDAYFEDGDSDKKDPAEPATAADPAEPEDTAKPDADGSTGGSADGSTDASADESADK
ncbi:hypothetical protein [Streptomyces neyagawaensis]|uniref:hypothetical protein n=1 Tax=Streptomyces neyagawaensis TaxID=42238 RepID=UPI0006E33840|nr:hypothetical protein [Streptomyces neyagawaensis]MCL6736543.1 hypothetical protein [Streptomyces neyagawaensis]MDE1680937.1 hypothetical protein [Streptomyces neyagawaensis]